MHICATSLRALAHRTSLNGLMFDISSSSISPSLQSGVARFLNRKPSPPQHPPLLSATVAPPLCFSPQLSPAQPYSSFNFYNFLLQHPATLSSAPSYLSLYF